jgi:hypothetical protein
MHRHVVLPAVLLMLGGLAQAQPAPPAPNPGNKNCAPDAHAQSPTVGSGQSSSNLSDRLASSNGVICPPANVDPEINKPAPGGGRMQIIPPPGSPGGDQKTVPK